MPDRRGPSTLRVNSELIGSFLDLRAGVCVVRRRRLDPMNYTLLKSEWEGHKMLGRTKVDILSAGFPDGTHLRELSPLYFK